MTDRRMNQEPAQNAHARTVYVLQCYSKTAVIHAYLLHRQALTDPAQSSGRVQSRVLLLQACSKALRTVSNKYNALLVALGGCLVYTGPADGPGLSSWVNHAGHLLRHEKQIYALGVCAPRALVAQQPPQHQVATRPHSKRGALQKQ